MHKYTNRLINENSPYLLQHAHNPVDWYAWGEEALQKAKTENKVVLVSIGYSACHWCHVMERESFENEEVATLMNDHFINIKIDREERPDLDHIYMDAVQAISGSGGWPLNVFLTPNGKPFYGGTYFPPAKAFNRSSWTEVLNAIAESWRERKHEIESQAENLTSHLQQSGNFGQLANPPKHSLFTPENCGLINDNILKQADKEWGGFGKAPKFPQTFAIQYLLHYYHYTQNEEALQQALLSIDKMLEGGIYDHAGGGFARYSTDREWLAPHFEKMLYDNALLLGVIADAFQITRQKKYENSIRHTVNFLTRELYDKNGGFYAALDADSEGEEGRFYVWSQAEINTVLGEHAGLFNEFFDVTPKGNWEGQNILRIVKETEAFAGEKNITVTGLENILDNSLQKLFAVRSERVRPVTDDKILLGWNALAVTALCKAAAALEEESYKALAVKTMDFILQKFVKKGNEFYHTYKNGIAKYPAFLDDYAWLIQACISLQEITSGTRYLDIAKGLTEFVVANFTDDSTGYFYYTHQSQDDIVVRKKEVYDGATPSGNSTMAENLLYLSVVYDIPDWKVLAEKNLSGLGDAIIKYPTSFGIWASLLLKTTFGINELVITGTDFAQMRDKVLFEYLPGKILQSGRANENERFPMFTGKESGDETRIYLCRQYSCKAPVNSIKKLIEMIKKKN